MQYWGLFVTVITFVLDIYLTFKNDEQEDEEAKAKKDDEITRNVQDSARTSNSKISSSVQSLGSSTDKPILRKRDRPLFNSVVGDTGNMSKNQSNTNSTTQPSSYDQESTGRSPVNQLLV